MPTSIVRHHARSLLTTAAVSAALCLSLAPLPAEAQYFGRNKVNYEQFDFRILKAPRFDIYFYPAESLATADASRMLERWYERFSPFLNHTFDRRSVILFADQADFQQNNVVDIESEGTGGVTEGFRERVVLPFTGVYADNHHVLGHELVHVFQYGMSRRQPAAGGEGPPGGGTAARGGGLGLNALPLWFVEGMAEYLSAGRNDPNTAMWLRDAVRRDDFPTIRQLTTDTRFFPYRYGQALWAYVGGRYGDAAVMQVFRAALRRGVEPAIRTVLRTTADSLSADWAAATRAAYGPVLAGRTPPESVGTRLVIQRTRRGGEYNISPTISPDGRHVAFFSSRGLFAINIYVADAESGRIIRELGSLNSPSHYDALSFLSSPGSWSPDGRRLAYVVYRRGHQVIDLYDMQTGRTERTVTAPGVGAALDPSWSPDGRYIAFSGMVGGISELFLYDLTTGGTQQLTEGRNAEIQPAWSPDGRTIAFATDRGDETSFDRMTFGPMRLATMDVATREVRLLPSPQGGKAINPQYSADGSSIFFVSDGDGVSDVYRHELATGSVSRITRVASGVSGITSLSPAISVARQTGRLVLSLFRGQGYDIVRLDPAQLVGTVVSAPQAGVAAAGVLPPAPASGASLIQQYLADATTGLPSAGERYEVVPYRTALKLDYVAPPTVGASFGGPFGTQVGGGIAASFSDQLGNHNLIGILQAQGELKDIGGQIVYLNSKRRWNYGAVVGRVPYVSGFSFYQEAENAIIYNQVIQRVYFNEAGAFAQYPFSPTRRLELSASVTRQSYSVDIDQYALDASGRVLDQQRISGETPDPMTYTQAVAALVGDYSYFGLTSPVAGGRYRFQVSPTMGALTYTTSLADYRRYLFARPITFAARLMQYGRYGRDAEDSSRLVPVFVGQPWFVRGYDPGDFRSAECTSQGVGGSPANECPVFNRLIGSRIAVANAEVRIPVLGPFGFGLIATRFLPLEISPFMDMGWAWRSGESPTFRLATGDEARITGDRIPVFSTGISARTNLFGYAILEVYYAHPFQRPDRGAHFGFQLAPGW
jgi:Tol biopolymer transport system component